MLLYQDIYDNIFKHVTDISTIKNLRLSSKIVYDSVKCSIREIEESISLMSLFNDGNEPLFPSLKIVTGNITIHLKNNYINDNQLPRHIHSNDISRLHTLIKYGMKRMRLHFICLLKDTVGNRTLGYITHLRNIFSIIYKLDYLNISYTDGIFREELDNRNNVVREYYNSHDIYPIVEMTNKNNQITVRFSKQPTYISITDIFDFIIYDQSLYVEYSNVVYDYSLVLNRQAMNSLLGHLKGLYNTHIIDGCRKKISTLIMTEETKYSDLEWYDTLKLLKYYNIQTIIIYDCCINVFLDVHCVLDKNKENVIAYSNTVTRLIFNSELDFLTLQTVNKIIELYYPNAKMQILTSID